MILFLTDGQDTEGFKSSDLRTVSGLSGVQILTYSFGPEADTKLPKQIACQNNGIWYHVMDKNDIEDTMTKYYGLVASGIDSSAVRWTEYADTVTGTPLIAGCLSAYDRSNTQPELVGVSCMDINIMISVGDLMEKPTFGE